MFEARLAQGVLLRKLLDSMKDLVQASDTSLAGARSCDQQMSALDACSCLVMGPLDGETCPCHISRRTSAYWPGVYACGYSQAWTLKVWLALLRCCERDEQQPRVYNTSTPVILSITTVSFLMQDANFDCSSTGFALQAMDSSHVSLIHMQV